MLLGEVGAPESLPPTGEVSAAASDGTLLAVATWDGKLHRLEGDAWRSIDVDQPILALAYTSKGLVLADAGGGLSLLGGTASVPIQEMAAQDPIVELARADDGLLAIAAGGGLVTSKWPGVEGARLTDADTELIGRAHALFATAGEAVIVAGAGGVGVWHGARLVATSVELDERVRSAAVFANGSRMCFVTDAGSAYVADQNLARVVRARGGGSFIGAAASADGAALAWTADGALYAISADGAAAKLPAANVVLAARGNLAVHWTAAQGVKITRGVAAWA